MINDGTITIQTNPLRKLANEIAENKRKNELRNKKASNDISNIIINKSDTNIPNNLPVAIIGDKGSGKSTLIKSIMKATYENHIFNHIYFIYSSLSWDEELEPYITKIDINNCDEFLANLFEIKTIYNSYIKFFERMNKKLLKDSDEFPNSHQQAEANHKKLLATFLKECDNNIIKYNQNVINSGMDAHVIIDKLIDVGTKIITKFSKDFYLGSVKVEGLKKDERDAIFIDDIAIASKILFRQIKDNPLYEYLTLTRHMRLFICFAGQQIEQIPKSIRREIMCWLLSKNTNTELLTGVLQKSTIQAIINKQQLLQKYEFVLYNCVDGYLGVL